MPKHLTLACLGALKLYELENFRVSGSLPQFIFEVCSALYRSPSLHTWLQLIKEKKQNKGVRCLFPLVGHAQVSLLNFNVGRARLFELVSLVGVFKVSPHACEMGGNLKVAVLFGSNLK